MVSTSLWATFNAQLEHTTIREGESAQLYLETDSQASGEPDTSSLQRDFEIIGTQRGSQVNIINGSVRARTHWTLTLAPKRSGTLTIPSLSFNGEQSRPLKLQVVKAGSQVTTAGAALFIESETDLKAPYVQQMVQYTVRLYFKAQLAEGSLSDPEVEHAMVHRIGEDREYQTERKGERYRVIERKYAIFPQKSGPLSLPSPVLNARIVVPSQQRTQRSPIENFFSRGRGVNTQQIRIRGEGISLDVRPMDPKFTGTSWLPATSVILTERWQPDEREVSVGEPIQRTVTVSATAMEGSLLPELSIPSINSIKRYPEPATNHSRVELNQVIGERIEKMAYIPTQPGEFMLPPLQLPWWNSETGQTEIAHLPERRIIVLPTTDHSQRNEPSTSQLNPLSTTHPETPAATLLSTVQQQTDQNLADSHPVVDQRQHFWPWLTLLFAISWIITMLLWWKMNRAKPASNSTSFTETESCKSIKRQFISACNNSDPLQARTALLQWAACHWPKDPPKGLDALTQRLDDPAIAPYLSELDRVLYQPQRTDWKGATLAQQLKKLPTENHNSTEERALKPLYP